ncbi:PAS domain-containing sensor histidine kinase [Aquabacterium sp. UBA2148]|uniref:PAS domain-containing sensor histidine kinase n=1 Tax=Aquabacterium sp. UBA2148 TaxID=1946042 RepID=UPI00257EA72E|nr:HAMP domain-containing sensor histidine kinase [Aquabacterium sp. UBA2148]
MADTPSTQVQPTALLAPRHHCLGLAMAAMQRGDMDRARQVLDAHPEASLTLTDVFGHYKVELETQNQELRQAQLRTEALLAWTDQLFRQLPVPALLLDAMGLIQDANERAINDLGLNERTTSRGMPFRRLMASIDCEYKLQHTLHAALDGHMAALADVQVITARGDRLWTSLTVVPMQDRPGESGSRLMCIIDDQTARLEARRAQEAATMAAQQRDFARATSEANHRMMARVSHEFRTPLNAVIGFSDLLLDPGRRPPEHVAQEFLTHIRSAGTNLLGLVEEVLQINRINGQEASGPPAQPVDLRAVAAEVIELLSDMANRCGVSLSMADDEGHACCARGHPRKVREVLINLLSNAIKYNLPSGWVRVALGSIGQHVWLGVSDSGKGMSRQQLDHLFEPFNRLGAESGNLHGHGLGLVITKGLVEGMDGRLTVTSTPGVGSCFVAELPLWHEEGA